jgi:hypothetical protein
MAVETVRYIRKPLYVDAVRVAAANFDDVADWCQGEVLHEEMPDKGTIKKYIKVRVHNPKNVRQTKAFIGDWLLYTERGYKVYTNKAFHASFNRVQEHVDTGAPITMVTVPPRDEVLVGNDKIDNGTSVNDLVEAVRQSQDGP